MQTGERLRCCRPGPVQHDLYWDMGHGGVVMGRELPVLEANGGGMAGRGRLGGSHATASELRVAGPVTHGNAMIPASSAATSSGRRSHWAAASTSSTPSWCGGW